jgi:hypothetical protein
MIPDLCIDNRFYKGVHQGTDDRKCHNCKVRVGGHRDILTDNRNPGESYTEKHQGVNILVNDPVKNSPEIRMCIGHPGHAAVNKIKYCRQDKHKAPCKKPLLEEKESGCNPGKEGEHRDLVGSNAELNKNSCNRFEVPDEPRAERSNIH